MRYSRFIAIIVCATILGFIILVSGIMIMVNRMSFLGKVAEIEQLRKDVVNISASKSEDVIGQVTTWNQTISSHKKYNQIWWSDRFIPDGWNDIDLISIPSR